jgi:hypothetical protein
MLIKAYFFFGFAFSVFFGLVAHPQDLHMVRHLQRLK